MRRTNRHCLQTLVVLFDVVPGRLLLVHRIEIDVMITGLDA